MRHRASREAGPAAGAVHARLIAAAPEVKDIRERRRAELTAALLLVATPLGFSSALYQRMFVPSFAPSFLPMLTAIFALAVAYVLSRTRHHRIATVITALTPLLASACIGALQPRDPAWFAYIGFSPLLASALLPVRHALAISLITILAAFVVGASAPPELRDVHLVPLVVFNMVLALLALLTARHRNQVEHEREIALREREAELAEARRMEAIGRLAGGIAHDFNNALAVVLANTELMERGVPRASGTREIRAAAEHARGLVQQLLAYSRRQKLTPVLLDVVERLRALEPMLRGLAGEGRELRLLLDGPPLPVMMDATGLEQVVVNLVTNARDATSEGSAIVIAARAETVLGEVGGASGAFVLISVRDSGAGMDASTAARALEPFFTTKPVGRGTGLGLALVDGTVRQSGGFVIVETAPGQGTDVRVHLPRASEQVLSSRPPSAAVAE